MTIFALLSLISCSLLAIRFGSLALERTGISRDAASFQAMSAFFGAGFTTTESEMVVNHPVRRRVIRHLIVLGNIGLTTFVATAVVSIATPNDNASRLQTVGLFALGFVALWLLSRTKFVVQFVDFTLNRALNSTSVVCALDYEQLLRVRDGFTVAEIAMEPKSPLVGKDLAAVRLNDKQINVLGITREAGEHIPSPNGTTRIEAEDTLLLYGPVDAIRHLLLASRNPGQEPETAPQKNL